MKNYWVLIAGAMAMFLVSCQPRVVELTSDLPAENERLVEEPTARIIRGTSRPNAIDRYSFEPDLREGRYFEWVGGARTPSWREGLRLRYNTDGQLIEGEYALGSVGILNFGFRGLGRLTGTIVDGVLEGTLTMEDGCGYTVFGAVTNETIRAYADPVDCAKEEQQYWELGKS